MKAFAIDTLTLISNNQPTPGFILQTPIEGLEGPNLRNTSLTRPGRNGSTMSSQFYDTRQIKLTGVVYGNNPAEFETNRQLLIKSVGIKRSSSGYPIPTRIPFTTLAGISYFVDVFFDKPIFSYDQPNVSQFMITATAMDSFIYGATQIVSPSITPPTGGGYVVPMVVPYTSSGAAGGMVVLNNAGTETTLPIITLYGSLTSPTLTNQTTGSSLQLSTTIAAGTTVTIDMYQQLITLNNSSSLMSAKTSVSDWWGLAPGNNNISLNSSSTADTGRMVVGGYPAYVGV